jgi:hypothetical protein
VYQKDITEGGPLEFFYIAREGFIEFPLNMAREGPWSFLYSWRGKDPGVSSTHDNGGTLEFSLIIAREGP